MPHFDDARPTNGEPVTGADLWAGSDLTLAGRAAPAEHNHAIGRNIECRGDRASAWFSIGVAVE